MRKLITALFLGIILTASSVCIAESYVWAGSGTIVESTTTPLTTLVPNTNRCYAISIYNSGSETVFFTLATSTNSFVAATAIPLPGGLAWTDPGGSGLNEAKNRPITAVTHTTTNSTSTLIISCK